MNALNVAEVFDIHEVLREGNLLLLGSVLIFVGLIVNGLVVYLIFFCSLLTGENNFYWRSFILAIGPTQLVIGTFFFMQYLLRSRTISCFACNEQLSLRVRRLARHCSQASERSFRSFGKKSLEFLVPELRTMNVSQSSACCHMSDSQPLIISRGSHCFVKLDDKSDDKQLSTVCCHGCNETYRKLLMSTPSLNQFQSNANGQKLFCHQKNVKCTESCGSIAFSANLNNLSNYSIAVPTYLVANHFSRNSENQTPSSTGISSFPVCQSKDHVVENESNLLPSLFSLPDHRIPQTILFVHGYPDGRFKRRKISHANRVASDPSFLPYIGETDS